MSDFPTFSLASTITPSDFLAPTIALRLSDYRLSTMKLTHRASQSREKSQKIARKITEKRPDFRPGCCAGAVAAVGLPSPVFLYPGRLALCGRLCTLLCGVLAAGSIGTAPRPGVALWGFYGRFRRCSFPGLWIACACAPLWAALWPVSGLACVPVPLPGCVALCALCGGCGRVLRRGCDGASRAACPLYAAGIAPGAAVLSIARAWSCGRLYGDGQRKARASCTSSTRAQKNRRRDCTRGGSVVSFIHFQKL